MTETKECEVGGKRYKIAYLTTNAALRVLTRLTHVFGPSIAQLVTADRKDVSSIERATGDAFAIFCRNITDEDLDALRKAFGDVTWCLHGDGREQLLSYQIQDIHFRGQPLAVFQWLWECLQWNYADFFEGATSLLGLIGVRKESPSSSESPKESIGGSGES